MTKHIGYSTFAGLEPMVAVSLDQPVQTYQKAEAQNYMASARFADAPAGTVTRARRVHIAPDAYTTTDLNADGALGSATPPRLSSSTMTSPNPARGHASRRAPRALRPAHRGPNWSVP